jgi:hypothetical protein
MRGTFDDILDEYMESDTEQMSLEARVKNLEHFALRTLLALVGEKNDRQPHGHL